MSGKHKKHIDDENMKCFECHESVVNGGFNIISPARHVNGVKDVQMTAGGTWTPSNKKCSGLPNGCHEGDDERW